MPPLTFHLLILVEHEYLYTVTNSNALYAAATDPDPCTARKLRRLRRREISVGDIPDPALSPSKDDLDDASSEAKGDVFPASNKLFFTVWKTSTSTAVVTSTAINSSITISASAYCTYAGFTGPLC